MINKIFLNAKNIPGWRTPMQFFVIESDDWGSTRMPSRSIFEQLVSKGIRVDKNKFTTYDTLASAQDLELLFEVLTSVSDSRGKPAVFSPFVNVTNAAFEKIKASNYTTYYNEWFNETLNRYHGTEAFERWMVGLTAELFIPQYHGREHFNVPYLMKLLQKRDVKMLEAFDREVVHIPLSNLPKGMNESLAATYYYNNDHELEYNLNSLRDGIEIFEKIFNRSVAVFGPPNGVFDYELEEAFKNSTVRGIVVNRTRLEPDRNNGLKSRNFLWRYGSPNYFGQVYYRRNVKFEPIQKQYSLSDVKQNIASAFRWKKPAVLSSHRINYVGTLDSSHRDKALRELKKVLEWTVSQYPNVQFVSSSELVSIMQ